MKEAERLSMSAAMWLLLDNLRSGWPVGQNLTSEQVQSLLPEAEGRGFVKDGKITPVGIVAVLGSSTHPEENEE